MKQYLPLISLMALAASPASAVVVAKPLSEMGMTAPIRLQGVDAKTVIKIPVSPRENIEAFKVVIDYSNSASLQENRSSLVFRLNDRILAQKPLTNTGMSKTAELVIPRAYLQVGYNDLTIQAIQHYTYECEDQNSTELWTEINTDRSQVLAKVVDLKYNGQPNLSQLGVLYDARAWKPQTVSFIAGSGYASDSTLTASSLISQGIALRKKNIPTIKWVAGETAFKTSSTPESLPGLNLDTTEGDIVLVGRKSEISRYLDTTTYQSINGAYLGLKPLSKEGRVAMIVSGETDEQVLEAAKVFADPEQIVPAEQQAILKFTEWQPTLEVQPNSSTLFSKLGFRTTTLQGLNPGVSTLAFVAPADYVASKGTMSNIKLHFAYAGGIREDSTLVLKLNGHFVSSVPLNNKEGQEFTKLNVAMPSEYILPGRNVLTFEPVFMTTKEKCGMIRDQHMHLTLYEDSELELSKSNGTLPDLDLNRFGRAGWPYTSETNQLFISSRDPLAFEAALTYVAMHANQISKPKLWTLTTTAPQKDNYLMIGEVGAIDNNLLTQIKGTLPKGMQLQFAQAKIGSTTTNPQLVTTISVEQMEQMSKLLKMFHQSGQWDKLEGASAMYNSFDNSLQSISAPPPVQKNSIVKIPDALNKLEYSEYILWAIGLALILALSVSKLTNKKQRDRHEV